MDKTSAGYLLTSLIERINRDQIGSVSGPEKEALAIALLHLTGRMPDAQGENGPLSAGAAGAATNGTSSLVDSTVVAPAHKPVDHFAPPPLPHVELVLDAVLRDEPTNADVLLCLDFGTAMSKAFAAGYPNENFDLALGATAGRDGYTLPSSVFIGDDYKAYFGYEAIEKSEGLVESGRERLDSIKSWLSLRHEGDLDGLACLLTPVFNPAPFKLTQGDLIRIYLAYLTDIATTSLSSCELNGIAIDRYVKRRFARPCWPNDVQAKWADRVMRELLAEAQILADTFRGQWRGGIEVGVIKAAIEKVKLLDDRPDYLIDMGVPEPVAVAASAFSESENARDAFMVVDAGAGTTDFGLFISTRHPKDEVSRVFQVSTSIQGLMQAGDKIDSYLRGFIGRKESFDTSDTSGKLIEADLRRRIRGLKEQLFKTKKLEYSLIDGTVGVIDLADFLADPMVEKFTQSVEAGFRKSLEMLDETWLKWLANDQVKLHVVVTGGSSGLPMMKSLGKGVIIVRGHSIMRSAVDPVPRWMEDQPEEFVSLYPQLAVAIGGTALELPETLTAPPVFGGGATRSAYVAGSLHVSGA